MTESTRLIGMPTQYAIEGQILRNAIRQLRRPARREEVTVGARRVGRSDVHALTRADGTQVHLSGRRVIASVDAAELLFSRDPLTFLDREATEGEAKWLFPAALQPHRQSVSDGVAARDGVLASWAGKFSFREERREGDAVADLGLRPPQIGALYGILAHWKVSSAPATVVMPTGTGKTETMLALLARERLPRLLVIVPTNALREQIGEKFVTLGLLKTLGVMDEDALYPVVGLLEHKPRTLDEVDELFLRCNVIVTTMAITGQCDAAIQDRMAELCSHLFIDEARRVLERLLDSAADPKFPIVFDDDDAGEAADIVCIGVRGNRLLVHLYHCKFSVEAVAGARVDDLYAVCGQAQRSVHWRASVPELFKHLRRREDGRRARATRSGQPHVSRFERGDLGILRDIGKQVHLLVPEFKIFVVQPGLSRAAAVNKQLKLLAATEVYLMGTSSTSFGVIASA